ncbi:GNAT family N-acetyltransferase [Solitalea sp. MAHUQ-68]|uniref:GNAT family N-acetyltransferase n=1 Tax=Solitalea agri TaxID=2953739 RepID=A0A9X2F317_9SPHI|nr:GNAT family N-acetyltransferase [Solitalea agri]MCO4293712.1 GNAT family N-acetyltransferase [Solitalea agri]
MQIKRITAAESSLVTDLFNNYRIFYKQASDILLAQQFIQKRLDNNESIIFAALNDKDEPIGFTQLYPIYSSVRAVKNWLLNDLYVDADHRKQGVGEQLIKTALQFAKEDGANYVELSTAIDNYTAQSLYEQIGFERQSVDSEFYTYRIKVV